MSFTYFCVAKHQLFQLLFIFRIKFSMSTFLKYFMIENKFCFCNFLQPNVFSFQEMMINRFRSLVVVALGCVQKTSACKLPQHKMVINQIKQRDGRWKEGGKLLVNSRSKMWARQRAAGREEGKREQEMLRFPLDVRCVSVPDKLSLFPALCV